MATHAHGPRPEEQLSRRRPGTGSIDYHRPSRSWRGRYRNKGKVFTVYAKTRLRCEQKLLAVSQGGIMAEWEWEQKVRLLRRLRTDMWQLLLRRMETHERDY